MALSTRMQNLAKSPQIQRSSFRDMAGKMMGQKSMTKSVKKEMQKAGVYYGGKKMSRAKYEKNVRKFSQHLGEKGVKETRFAKQVRQSLRSKKGLVRGGTAEKEFQQDLKRQYKEGTPKGGFEDLDTGTKRKLYHKYLEKGTKGLTKDDVKMLGEAGVQELKERGDRMMAINKSRMQQSREEEGGEKKDETGMPKEKTTTAAAAGGDDKKGASDQGSSSAGSKSSGPVPLAGGASLGAGMPGNQIEGGMERMISSKLNSMENKPGQLGATATGKSPEAETSPTDAGSVESNEAESSDLRDALNKMVEGEAASKPSSELEGYPGAEGSSSDDSPEDKDSADGVEDIYGGGDSGSEGED